MKEFERVIMGLASQNFTWVCLTNRINIKLFLIRVIPNNITFAKAIEREMYKDFLRQDNVDFPMDPENYKGLNPYKGQGCDFKKCCKKYKDGKRCKKCPKR